MSEHEENVSHAGLDSIDHQPAFIYTPRHNHNDAPIEPPTKRRKIGTGQRRTSASKSWPTLQPNPTNFEPLLRGAESEDCILLRQELFQKCWSETDSRIQSVLEEANDDTLAEVTNFVNAPENLGISDRLPASFIVTGPNIASQGLLFKQLSTRLRVEVDGPVVVLRSGDASNLKAILKQLIRAATNQGGHDEEVLHEQDGRKLLYYDLEILRGYVRAHSYKKVVIAFQDSEGFETSLLVELITLFNSWKDRIPFVLLFGIATSVELFQERLTQSASRCIYGIQVDVEQSSVIIEKIFQKAVASSGATLRLGPTLLSTLIERQKSYVQSVQSFIAAIKYTYMCHFYGNALSVLSDTSQGFAKSVKRLQPIHFETIRMLPSFQKLVESKVEGGERIRPRELLEEDAVVLEEVEIALESKERDILRLLRALHVFRQATNDADGGIELYMTIFEGGLQDSEYLNRMLTSIKGMAPNELIAFTGRIITAIEDGSPAMELEGWADEDQIFLSTIQDIKAKIVALQEQAEGNGTPIRSSEVINSKSMRTTVIAQRVEMARQKSSLSEAERDFISLIEKLTTLLHAYFTLSNPQDLFLHETWLCDSTNSIFEVFAPKPRTAIEEALLAPNTFINCEAATDGDGPSATQPPVAILYQRYLEAGSLINMADMWSSFLEIVAGDDPEYNEREGLMLFYRGLADLKLLGMVKQSKKKTDHLAKVSWRGI
ncbi:hypothetical protein HYFRA_00009709 [Hymenoscyphus fraxineus]|uniref:Origin recognition complex subunit n=1 Tax=Hymenoscyphus fraxineus TaxID=746836 RepID=A0A9N9KTX3_9HELO|nr:hypothetical protein HYFRA_00009709 [Hymenoscyphus fraxineus]